MCGISQADNIMVVLGAAYHLPNSCHLSMLFQGFTKNNDNSKQWTVMLSKTSKLLKIKRWMKCLKHKSTQ